MFKHKFFLVTKDSTYDAQVSPTIIVFEGFKLDVINPIIHDLMSSDSISFDFTAVVADPKEVWAATWYPYAIAIFRCSKEGLDYNPVAEKFELTYFPLPSADVNPPPEGWLNCISDCKYPLKYEGETTPYYFDEKVEDHLFGCCSMSDTLNTKFVMSRLMNGYGRLRMANVIKDTRMDSVATFEAVAINR